MIIEIVVTVVIAALLGMVIAFILTRSPKFLALISKNEREKQKVLNDPEALCKILNDCKAVECGNPIRYKVNNGVIEKLS